MQLQNQRKERPILLNRSDPGLSPGTRFGRLFLYYHSLRRKALQMAVAAVGAILPGRYCQRFRKRATDSDPFHVHILWKDKGL